MQNHLQQKTILILNRKKGGFTLVEVLISLLLTSLLLVLISTAVVQLRRNSDLQISKEKTISSLTELQTDAKNSIPIAEGVNLEDAYLVNIGSSTFNFYNCKNNSETIECRLSKELKTSELTEPGIILKNNCGYIGFEKKTGKLVSYTYQFQSGNSILNFVKANFDKNQANMICSIEFQDKNDSSKTKSILINFLSNTFE